MSEITLVALDMDGTLLTSSGVLPPRGAAAIRRCHEQGIAVVLATTKYPEQVGSYSRQLGLHDPMICTNGAQIWASPDGPVWAYRTIPKPIALAIAHLADCQGWELSTRVETMTYWKRRAGQVAGLLKAGVTIVERNADAIRDAPLRILVHDPQAILAIQTLCAEQYPDQCALEVFYEPDGSLHSLAVLAPQTDKGTALQLVLERLHLPPEKVMAIGDNLNDLAMLEYVGFPVAVGNAVEMVKQVAKVVAPDNDHEGVAWALETYVLD